MTDRLPENDSAVKIDPASETWRVNFQELNRRVYNGIAVETVKTGLEGIDGLDKDKCARVVEAMLYATESPPPTDSPFESVVPLMSVSRAMTLDGIMKASEDIHDAALARHEIKDAIAAMLADSKAEQEENNKKDEGDRQGLNFLESSDNDGSSDDNDDMVDTPVRKRRKAAMDADARIRETAEVIASQSTTTGKLPPLSSCLKLIPSETKPDGKKTPKTYLFDTPTALKIARPPPRSTRPSPCRHRYVSRKKPPKRSAVYRADRGHHSKS